MQELDTLANIATIFLILEALIILIVLAALSFGLARALIIVRRKTIEVMPQIQGKARQLADTTENVSQKVASPFIGLEATQARLRGMRQRAFFGGPSSRHSQPAASKEE